MKKLLLIMMSVAMIVESLSAVNKSKKEKSEEVRNFNGVITYIGKVTRIPDRKRTSAKLQDFDSFFDVYMNDDYTKKVENINNQIVVSSVTGIRDAVFFQTIESMIDKSMIYITATPDEQMKYQLTPLSMKTNSKKVTYTSGKKKICGKKCKKVVCNMVTEDNIHIQLVAWYDPGTKLNGLNTPYFGEIKGMPLMYDFYTGEYVVTYTATKMKRSIVVGSMFDRPASTPISMTEYIMSQQ